MKVAKMPTTANGAVVPANFFVQALVEADCVGATVSVNDDSATTQDQLHQDHFWEFVKAQGCPTITVTARGRGGQTASASVKVRAPGCGDMPSRSNQRCKRSTDWRISL